MIVEFNYDQEKNNRLLADWGMGFDEIIGAIKDGNLLCIKAHHNQEKYPHQGILYVKMRDEVYAVPFVKEKNDTLFLKTLFPSRKARKLLAK